MREAIPFRAWFYFRMGWATYFAFIFAAVNTLTVTYFLAIENYPSLQVVFPSFAYYIVIVSLIGVPLLVAIGYIHFKKSCCNSFFIIEFTTFVGTALPNCFLANFSFFIIPVINFIPTQLLLVVLSLYHKPLYLSQRLY